MYGTSNDRHLIRQRNQELLREVRAARLERSLRAKREHRSSVRRIFRLPVQGTWFAFSRHAKPKEA